jgi:hypothetical protein
MPRPPITAKGEGLFRRQLEAALDWLEANSGGGGGGGPAAWGSITGTLSSQADLQTALNGKANSSHTHAQSEITGLTTALAGIPARGVATVTVPNGRKEWQETVTATGVVPADVVLLSVAPHLDADENDAEMLDVLAASAAAGTNQITVTLAFGTPAAGAIKLNWMAA